jgi:hypothetical protein
MTFNKWSQLNPSAQKILAPDLGIRSWDQVDAQQKKTIWLHFRNKGWFDADEDTYYAISQFNEDNKARSFCNHLQQHGGAHWIEMHDVRHYMEKCCFEVAQRDFDHIFHTEVQDVFYELLSYYVPALERGYDKDKVIRFRNLFNDISNQFGLNVLLNESGFILRQDSKITDAIYVPVLNYLNDKKWEPVNRDLADSMTAYLKNSEEAYSTSITLTISALQGFLQIMVNGSIGKGDLGNLITEAQTKKLIPSDPFTIRIFKDIESILMQERQEKGHPHPKKEYANEKSARLILNLTMIFMQHCLQ